MIQSYIMTVIASVFATYLIGTSNFLSGTIFVLVAMLWLYIAIQATIDRSNA